MTDPKSKSGPTATASNRRDFLRGSGLAAATAVLTGQATVALDEAKAAEAEPKVLSGDVQITLKVNGQDRTLHGRAAEHAARHAAQPARRDRPQAGLRPGELRRLHRDRRRRPGLLLHHAGRLLPGQDDRDPGELRHRRERRPARLPPERRPDVRLLHARVRHRVQGAARQEPEPDARGGQARGSTATSAGAARTSACSRRPWPRPKP